MAITVGVYTEHKGGVWVEIGNGSTFQYVCIKDCVGIRTDCKYSHKYKESLKDTLTKESAYANLHSMLLSHEES